MLLTFGCCSIFCRLLMLCTSVFLCCGAPKGTSVLVCCGAPKGNARSLSRRPFVRYPQQMYGREAMPSFIFAPFVLICEVGAANPNFAYDSGKRSPPFLNTLLFVPSFVAAKGVILILSFCHYFTVIAE